MLSLAAFASLSLPQETGMEAEVVAGVVEAMKAGAAMEVAGAEATAAAERAGAVAAKAGVEARCLQHAHNSQCQSVYM